LQVNAMLLGGWSRSGIACILLAIASAVMVRAEGEEKDSQPRVAVSVARDRAKVMHDVYAATLEVMHDRYFHDDRAIVPARALEDVFAELAKQSAVKANWIAVNTKAMSINHEPKTNFEKQAATELAAGKDEYELIEKGVYQRAAPIALTGGCVSCHTGFFSGAPKSPRFAGLVITIPVEDK
jgi:hypothetical protein